MANLSYTVLALASAGMWALAVGLAAWALYPRTFIAEAIERKGEAQGALGAAQRVLFDRLAPFTMPLLGKKSSSRLQQRLIMMGAPNLRPVDIITMQVLCSILFTLLVGLLLNAFGVSLLWSALGTAFGAYLPLQWMRSQIRRRHMAIARAMPFNLDLLTLSVEAGLDFGSGVSKVVERGRPGPFRDELAFMLREIRMGKTREEALRNMADRVRLPALSKFVGNLIQAEKMGTGLGKVLRIQSSQLRIERTQRAEKLANEAPVKMLFPLIFCIFPTVFMIIFGPIIYNCQFIGGGE